LTVAFLSICTSAINIFSEDLATNPISPPYNIYVLLFSKKSQIRKNITVQDISDEVARKIRKDKLLHMFLSLVSPATHTDTFRPRDEEAFQRRLERRRERNKERTERTGRDTSFYEEQRADPNSLYHRMKRLDRSTSTYWDMAAPHVQQYKYFKGNASKILLHMVLLTTKFEWQKFPGFDFNKETGGLRTTTSGSSTILGVRFPTRQEMDHHFKTHRTHESVANALMSITRFMRGFTDESTINVDQFLRDMDDSYHKSDAPSVRHAHLYSTSEERALLRSVIKEYQMDNPEYREGRHYYG